MFRDWLNFMQTKQENKEHNGAGKRIDIYLLQRLPLFLAFLVAIHQENMDWRRIFFKY